MDVTVALLAGGLGTRLRAAVSDRPKVLAQVNGRPFLSYLFDQVAEAGFEDVVVCTGYRAEAVATEFGATYGSLRLRYSVEPEPLGTGGALRYALPLLEGKTVLVLNGDSYAEADLTEFYSKHARIKARASLLLVWMAEPGRFGQVELSADGKIRSFKEKQPKAPAGWINAGIYLLEHDLIATIPGGQPVSLERDSFPRWLEDLRGVRVRGRFLDIGTPESYLQATEFFGARNSAVRVANGQLPIAFSAH
jgi:D-glycero-alpha-D-manno-heptose 1-phosphate guanylyltransferase